MEAVAKNMLVYGPVRLEEPQREHLPLTTLRGDSPPEDFTVDNENVTWHHKIDQR